VAGWPGSMLYFGRDIASGLVLASPLVLGVAMLLGVCLFPLDHLPCTGKGL